MHMQRCVPMEPSAETSCRFGNEIRDLSDQETKMIPLQVCSPFWFDVSEDCYNGEVPVFSPPLSEQMKFETTPWKHEPFSPMNRCIWPLEECVCMNVEEARINHPTKVPKDLNLWPGKERAERLGGGK
jgi:hypothetical protein